MVMMKLKIFYAFLFQWNGLSCPILTQIYLYTYILVNVLLCELGPFFSSYPATMHPWNKEALKSMRQELGRVEMDVVMIKKLEKSDMPSPANLGFLSREQLQVVESKVTPAAQMNKVIEYLVEMEDKYFEDFCTILEQSNYAGKAKMLRERADVLKKRSVGKFEYKRYTCMSSNITKTSCI